MTRRERLMATLNGRPVDRPAVSFYEIGGFAIDPADPDPFNVYNDPSWRPLLALAEEQSDIIRLGGPASRPGDPELCDRIRTFDERIERGARISRETLRVGRRTLTTVWRRDPEVNTSWKIEHTLKSVADLKTYLDIPDAFFTCRYDAAPLYDVEEKIGDAGIVLVDTADPICVAASLFSMEDFTVVALTERALFHRLLEKVAHPLYRRTEEISAAFPGRLWRIYGPEFATEPYLPPSLFEEYVVRYTAPIVAAIRRSGGFVRIHCHGRIRSALPMIAAMGADALDPIEPPPQGDVELAEVRREYGDRLVLFGNIEASDIENLPEREFELKVRRALEEGTAGAGRGFVLTPSASPYGREITPRTLANYETMIRLARTWAV